MKISILTPDLSHNCLGRAYLLAKILQRRYEVEIVGPVFGKGIWAPLANEKNITFRFVKMEGRFNPYRQLRRLSQKIDGDVIYAQKPLFTSYFIGLLNKVTQKRPLILDIDDWQVGITKEIFSHLSFFHRIKRIASSALYFYRVNSYWNSLLGERLAYLADEITVSNRLLQTKFGGTIIWHGRDTKSFDPGKFDNAMLRRKYHIGEHKKVVMFLGTPRAFKGIEDLVKAIELLNSRTVLLMIIGFDSSDPYSRNLREAARKRLGEEKLIDLGLQPFEKVPEILSMADIVVIPQKKNWATIGQLPAKVFDAMAMAKPIIATNVSDLPEILENCGWIVEPGSPEGLAQAIQHILRNAEEAEKRRWKARTKCIEDYSWEAMDKVLFTLFGKYE